MTDPSDENSRNDLADSLNYVLFMLDSREVITYVSSRSTAILGFLPEEMVGRPLSTFASPVDDSRVGTMAGPTIQDKNQPAYFRMVGKDGMIHTAALISPSHFGDSDGTMGIIGKSSTGEYGEKIIRQAITSIHLFNSIVRHDINNQLTVLNGYLSLIEQDKSTIESPGIVRILLGSTEKIHKIITFTSLYKDVATHPPGWINLYRIFQGALTTFDAAGVQITISPSCRELELFCDPQLMKIFPQLIDNSIRHGMTVSRISLGWRPDNENAIIVYEDNGCGISPPLKPILFQRVNGKKIGFGMFFVREILAISGFTITETGTPGKGVRFEITVPAGSFRIVKQIPQ